MQVCIRSWTPCDTQADDTSHTCPAVGARWFGAQTATPADFEVVGCKTLTLNVTGGRAVPVFNSTQNNGCKVRICCCWPGGVVPDAECTLAMT